MGEVIVMAEPDNGESEDRCCSPRIERGVDALHAALPALTRADIAASMGESVAFADQVLGHMRIPGNARRHGWTVPHSARGPARWNVEARYFAVLVDNTGEPFMEQEQTGQVKLGAVSTLQTVGSFCRNEGYALELAADYAADEEAREAFGELTELLDFLGKRVTRALRHVSNGN